MNCEICGSELQGDFEIEELEISGLPFLGINEPSKRDWMLCKFCNVLVCHECCLKPESGYCNNHLPYYYNFPESEFDELLEGS